MQEPGAACGGGNNHDLHLSSKGLVSSSGARCRQPESNGTRRLCRERGPAAGGPAAPVCGRSGAAAGWEAGNFSRAKEGLALPGRDPGTGVSVWPFPRPVGGSCPVQPPWQLPVPSARWVLGTAGSQHTDRHMVVRPGPGSLCGAAPGQDGAELVAGASGPGSHSTQGRWPSMNRARLDTAPQGCWGHQRCPGDTAAYGGHGRCPGDTTTVLGTQPVLGVPGAPCPGVPIWQVEQPSPGAGPGGAGGTARRPQNHPWGEAPGERGLGLPGRAVRAGSSRAGPVPGLPRVPGPGGGGSARTWPGRATRTHPAPPPRAPIGPPFPIPRAHWLRRPPQTKAGDGRGPSAPL